MKKITILFLLTVLCFSSFAEINLREIHRIDINPVGAVDADGQVVYAGVGGALNVYNIYHKDFPQFISTIDDRSSLVKAIRIEGDILWVMWEKEGLQAFDITDRYSPRFIGELEGGLDQKFGKFTSMDIEGDLAFVSGENFLVSVDISDPLNPEVLNFATLNGAPLRIDYFNNRLYIAGGNLGLAALFVPDPKQFFLIGTQKGIYTTVKAYGSNVVYGRLDEPKPNEEKLFRDHLFTMPFRSPMVVDVCGDYLFAGGAANFSIYQMPPVGGNPRLIWDLPDMPTYDCALHGDVVYLANLHKGLSVFDIHTPSRPNEIGRLVTHDFPRRSLIHDYKMYVAAGVSGVLVYDIGNPDYPRLVDTLASDKLELVWDVVIEGDYIYILGARESISDNIFIEQYHLDGEFSAEYPIERVDRLDPIGEMVFDSGRIAISLGIGGIAVCDFTDNRISVRYMITDRSRQFCDLEFVGKNLIASDFHGGYHIFALDRGIPPTIGYIKTSDEGGNGIAVVSDYLLGADGPNGLVVIDISDPARPSLVGGYSTTWATDIAIDGDLAYLADGQGALKIFDISNLPIIDLVAELPSGGYWTGVMLDDGYLFGIDRYIGIHVYEIQKTVIAKGPAEKPLEAAFIDVFPNPFNSRVSISIDIPKRTEVDLAIYDISGRKVTTIIDDVLPAGRYNLAWRADDQASGTYFAVLRASGRELKKKLLLVK
ncbi:T9SS type A sorting domain-containing protein [bacterium]|nr:T9SS type A sorting domain-containing protein [bacterium]